MGEASAKEDGMVGNYDASPLPRRYRSADRGRGVLATRIRTAANCCCCPTLLSFVRPMNDQ